MKKFLDLLEEMEQHKKDHSIPQDGSNVSQQYETQNDYQDILPVQNTDTEGGEIIEKSGITDCWYIPQNDTRTINQNIKTRNR